MIRCLKTTSEDDVLSDMVSGAWISSGFFRDGVINAAKRIRASLYMFGGVELLASEECWT